MEKELFKRASEALSNLEDRVFMLEHDNGEDWEDNKTSAVNKVFRSFEKLVEYTEAFYPKYQIVIQEHLEEGKPLEESYDVRFERKREHEDVKRLRRQFNELKTKWYGDGDSYQPTEEYLNLTEEQREAVDVDFSEVQYALQEEENDYSSYKMIIAELY